MSSPISDDTIIVARPFSPQQTGNTLSGVKEKSGALYEYKNFSMSPIPLSSSHPRNRRMEKGRETLLYIKYFIAVKATIAGPLSSKVPRPISSPFHCVSLKGSKFQPGPAGTKMCIRDSHNVCFRRKLVFCIHTSSSHCPFSQIRRQLQ